MHSCAQFQNNENSVSTVDCLIPSRADGVLHAVYIEYLVAVRLFLTEVTAL